MNKTLVIASVLMAAALTTGIFSTNPMAAYAGDDDEGDYSGTNTEQKIKQSNEGADSSTNNNCALNSLHTAEDATVACPVTSVQPTPLPPVAFD
jgi:hypothetical protein